MRDVFISGIADSVPVEAFRGNEVEFVRPAIEMAIQDAGLRPADIQFSTASSSDSFAGQAFSFVRMLDASGAYPALEDSHLDMDGAWALYEAWVRLQVGDIDTALVYALGRSSSGHVEHISPHTLDPYYLAPLALDSHAMGALHASRLLTDGIVTEAHMREVTERSVQAAERRSDRETILRFREESIQSRTAIDPLEKDMLPTPADAVAAVVLTTYPSGDAPVRLSKMQHRTDAHSPGVRDMSDSTSFRQCLSALETHVTSQDCVQLHTRYPHELILLASLIGCEPTSVIPPDGGSLIADPIMASGLVRHIEAVRALRSGNAKRAIAHATSGPALQQNLLSLIEVLT